MKAIVLIIDDDPVDLRALQQLVESWNLDTVSVRSGHEALALLSETPVDAVVSDVRMPGMSGEEVVEAVGRTCPGLPVVLITAHADIRSAVNAMKLGAFDYVVKPPDEDHFRLTVQRALEHGRLRRENEALRAQLADGDLFGSPLIGHSPAMQEVFTLINRVARTGSTVLVTGETGTGKELVARQLHYRSDRADHPFIALNCAAVNSNLIESELFGHERGAFTGAVAARRGRFELADGGTLFLDEIAETGSEFQAKLLRVLQESTVQRVGGSRSMDVDVRLIASTNRELADELADGRFRQDLYYRLNVIRIHLPPLRDRREDIEPLAAHFLAMYRDRYGGPATCLSPKAVDRLVARDWPGNVRELQHAMERAVVLATDAVLGPASFEKSPGSEAEPRRPDEEMHLSAFLDACTRTHLLRVLDQTGWRKRRAAELLGIDRATLYRLIKKLRLES